MKKIFLTALLICFVGTLSACGKEQVESVKESGNSVESSDNKESSASMAEEGNKEDETPNESRSSQENETKEDSGESSEEVVILPLQKQYFADYRWVDDRLVVQSQNNNLTLHEKEIQYPQMKQVLSELAGMQKRTYDDEADNIFSFAEEMGMLDENIENFETQISALDLQVRRADSVALSILADSYADYGFIENFRGLWGSNYDTQSGEELNLSDVILDMEPIPGIVLKELNSHLWAGEFYSEDVVENYFKNTTSDAISWTLDYDGVTFYFASGELAEPGNGHLTAKVSFAEYPELFNKKYMNVPKAYMVRMPLDLSFYADLDGNGDLETLECSGFYDESEGYYTDFGIYTEIDGYYHYEELFAYGFQPYYVKTADDNHYIYLFCEKSEDENRQMQVIIYNVKNSELIKVGESNVAPAYIAEDTFLLPLDPEKMILDNFDIGKEACVHSVGNTGLPENMGEVQ